MNTTQKLLLKKQSKGMNLSHQNPTAFWDSETSHQCKNPADRAESTQANQVLAKHMTQGRSISTRGLEWLWRYYCSQTASQSLLDLIQHIYLPFSLEDKAYVHLEPSMHLEDYMPLEAYMHLTRHLICTAETY